MKGNIFFKFFSSIFLILSISIFILFLVCFVTIFKDKYIMKTFNNDNYYFEVQNGIKTNVNKMDIDNKENIDSLFDIKIIKEDVNNYIRSYYTREAYTTHSQVLEKKLIEMEVDAGSIDKILSIYEKEVRMNDSFKLIPKSIFYFIDNSSLILLMTFNVAVISYLYLVAVCKFKNTGILILISSVLVFIIEVVVHRVYKIDMYNGWFRELYMSILSDVCFKLLLCGTLLFIGGLIIYFFEKVVSSKK